jgi:hypothetical protein
VRVASDLSRPLFVTAPPGDPRLFIVQQNGRVRILRNGTVLETDFLNVSTLLEGSPSGFDERGLLGLAFAPDYDQSGVFYVNYTRFSDSRTFIERYQASADPNEADAGSGESVLEIQQPFSNHNGGHLAFGPDGMLYIGLGDGGGAGDPQENAQDDGTLLGKMLRIDVSGGPGTTYTVPSDNPFVGAGDPLDEIWAKGLRNPYRYSFDRSTGDLYIGDVGQNSREEVDVQPSTSTGGENYGWDIMEGSICFEPMTGCNMSGLVLPVDDYAHVNGRCSVTGGYVYRGSITEIQGRYFFGDFCTAQIWTLVWDGGGGFTSLQDRTAELVPDVGSIGGIAGFGEDGSGELYIVDRGSGSNGEVFKIVQEAVEPPLPVPALPRWALYGLGLALLLAGLASLRGERSP